MGLLSLPVAGWFIAVTAPPIAVPMPVAAEVAAPATAPATALPAAFAPDIIAAKPDTEQRMTVAVMVGDKGPFRFLVDTGAQNTVLADNIAARLGLAQGEPRQISGVAGVLSVATVALRDVHIGRRSFDQRYVPVLRAATLGADGILGIDGLQGQQVLIDFRQNQLTITDAAAPSRDPGYEIVVTAQRRSGQLIVTHASIDGVDTDVVIDTGAEVSIGNRALQKALAQHAPPEPTRLRSVTGQEIAAEMSPAATLSIGRLRMAGLRIAYVDAPAFAALRLSRRPALLLGMRELRTTNRIQIDFLHRKVLFGVGS